MNILIATPWFPNRPDGWPGRFVADSVLALARAGSRVCVECFRGWAPPALRGAISSEHRGEIDREAFPEIDELHLTRYLALPGDMTRSLKNILLDRAVSRTLDDAVVRFRPGIILAHTEMLAPAAAKVASRHNIPLAIVLHGENTNHRYTSSPSQARRFRAALSRADKLVIVGEPMRRYAAKLAGRSDHIVTVLNGVTPPPWRRIPPIPDSEPIQLITVANLQEGKGVDLLLEACAHMLASGVNEWRLTIVGDGSQRSMLEAYVSDNALGSNVVFTGPLTNAEVFEHLRTRDVFVLPSYREAFGVAYLEAMALGLLTIGVEGQGPSQFIEHGQTGMLVRPRDAQSVEDALRAIIADSTRTWRSIASAGARYARANCGWDTHASALLEVLGAARDAVDRGNA